VITSGQSNLTQGRIADAHGWFSRIRLVAPMCTPSSTWSHRTQHPKLHIHRFSRFPQFHSSRQRVSILYNGPLLLPQNCPFAWWIWTPSNTRFLGPTGVHILNGITIGSAVFCGEYYSDRQTDIPTDHAILHL